MKPPKKQAKLPKQSIKRLLTQRNKTAKKHLYPLAEFRLELKAQ